MGTTILLVHGRDFSPPKRVLGKYWLRALRHGIKRDHLRKLSAFDIAHKELVYFGDISNKFLSKKLKKKIPDDRVDRDAVVRTLMKYCRDKFTKKTYQSLPGRVHWKRELAENVADLLYFVGLSEYVVSKFAPDMCEYWNIETEFGSDVRSKMIGPLMRAFQRGDQIIVVSHSLGSMIAYDTFWKFSHYAEYRPKCCTMEIVRWISLGSPLADRTVRGHLKGALVRGRRQYPTNIREWINIAAEDDYVAYKPKVAKVYREMKSLTPTREISDRCIYNLAVRHGKSNPHHSIGYLIHPETAKALAEVL